MKTLLILSSLLFVPVSVATAAPVILDFEHLPDQPVIGGVMSYGPTVVEDGFLLTTDAAFGGFATWPSNSVSYTGSKALFGNQVTANTTLTQINDNPFAIASMGMTFTNGVINSTAEFDITFTGFTSGNAVVEQTFSIGPGFNPSFQTLNFSGAFGSLLSLSWTHPSQTFQFDNVVVDGSPAVPAPAALALLGFGVLGLLIRRNRRV